MTRLIASSGGFPGRKADGEPGISKAFIEAPAALLARQ
jgi:hypothetical protein